MPLTWNQNESSNVEQAQVAFVRTGQTPIQAVVDEVLQGQHPSGGFTGFWTEGKPALDPTCYRLATLHTLGLLHLPETRHAAAFLLRNWTDAPEACELQGHLPPWLDLSEETTRYLKANSLYQLALQRMELPEHLMADLRTENLGFWQTHWLTAGLFHALGDTEAFERVALHLQLQLADLDAEDLMWWCESWQAVGVPVDHPVWRSAFERLVEQTGQTEATGSTTVPARVYRLGVLADR